jgi:hypothetical protein
MVVQDNAGVVGEGDVVNPLFYFLLFGLRLAQMQRLQSIAEEGSNRFGFAGENVWTGNDDELHRTLKFEDV